MDNPLGFDGLNLCNITASRSYYSYYRYEIKKTLVNALTPLKGVLERAPLKGVLERAPLKGVLK